MTQLDRLVSAFANLMWGPFLLILLVGGGLYFTVYCRFTRFRYFRHGVNILLGKYDRADDPGQINHFQALSSALAGTVGMGNISGVAVAINMGGPGALFWMWVTAFFGTTLKYAECTLSMKYREMDALGFTAGGPMYTIRMVWAGNGAGWLYPLPHSLLFVLSLPGMLSRPLRCLTRFIRKWYNW